ncbi:antibiotic biosynthesis monooxygenase [Acidisoma sp. C75]
MPEAPGRPAAPSVMMTVHLRPTQEQAFADWQARFARTVALAPGFISIEIIPAYAGAPEWRILLRFQSPAALEAWQAGAERATLLAALGPLRADPARALAEEWAPDFHSLTSVTEVVATEVEPGRQQAFQLWAEQMQAAQARFPGYMGTLIQAPLAAELPYWTTLVRFALPEQLETWLASAERRVLLARADPAVSRWQSRRLANPFAGWFPSEGEQPPVPAWKQSCLVLLVLFPVVMLELRFLMPLLHPLPPPIATFIGNALSVALVSWPLMKLAIWLLGWWLAPKAATRARDEGLGLLCLCALYAVEIGVFLPAW